jgi:hypothetical protein
MVGLWANLHRSKSFYMKKLSFVVLSVALFATACKKSDYLDANTTTATPGTPAAATATSPWKSLVGWQSKNYDKATVFTSRIADSSITSSVLSQGMVLAYKKSGTTIEALPLQQTVNGTSYFWFYQATQGGLQISVSESGSSTLAPATDHSLVYFVITPEKLSQLEAQGSTKAQLMNLSYEQAAALLK